MKPLVIFHANCADGFGAAWAAHTKIPDAEFVPCQYGQSKIDPIDLELVSDGKRYPITDRDVYVLDFSFPKEQIYALNRTCDHMIWLDHHRTAFFDFTGSPPEDIPSERFTQAQLDERFCTIVLDNHLSGAMLAWQHFRGFLSPPEFLQNIQDRDLWRFKLPRTRAVCLAIKELIPNDFEAWDKLQEFAEYENLAFEGDLLLRVMNNRVDRAVNRDLKAVSLLTGSSTSMSRRIHKGLAANVVNDISEIGNAIAQKSGTYSLTFFVQGDEVICSLRSLGDYDVSVIAKAYGGGGHKNAAGFKMPIWKFFDEVWS